MTISQMLSQSALLTLLGMGVVFSFLIIMIGAMYLLHAVIHALKLDKDPVQKQAAVPAASSTAAPVDNGAVIAAIAAAVHEKLS
ncbi:MAG: OadG family protein [Treponema sp.]|nr:OadG family protein [Treponema sp.]